MFSVNITSFPVHSYSSDWSLICYAIVANRGLVERVTWLSNRGVAIHTLIQPFYTTSLFKVCFIMILEMDFRNCLVFLKPMYSFNTRFPAHESHVVNNHLTTVGAIVVSYMPMGIWILILHIHFFKGFFYGQKTVKML